MSRRPVSAVALLLSAAALTGCGTGLEPHTYTQTGRQDGAFATVGGRTGIAVHRLQVAGPVSGSVHAAGDTAFVTGGLVNNGTSADALVGATTDVARSVGLFVEGTPTASIALPAGGTAPAGWSLALSGLTRELHVASYITITLDFQRAGKVTLQVPVEPGDNGLDDRTPARDPYTDHATEH